MKKIIIFTLVLSSYVLYAPYFDILFSANIVNGENIAYAPSVANDSIFLISANDCLSRNNRSTATVVEGFHVRANSSQNIFQNNIVTDCQAITPMTGFMLTTGCQDNVFQSCSAETNRGASVTGFGFSGGSTNNNSFFNCISQASVATTNNAYGFDIVGSNYGIMINCLSSFNRASSGIAAGLQFSSGTGGDEWHVQGCKFIRNIGSSDANSFGIRWVTGSNNWFLNNVANRNGSTSSSQLSGISAGAKQVAGTLSNLNGSVTIPWTNAACCLAWCILVFELIYL